MDDLPYTIYEQYSNQYIISVEQIKQHLQTHQITSVQDYLQTHCYYNLLTDHVDQFEAKLKHNLQLARNRHDHSFWQYMARKFHLHIDMASIDLPQWKYQPHKIKLKLKTEKVNAPKGYQMTPLLSNLLGVPIETTFTYKSDIIRLVHQYIYQHQLQDVKQKQTINPDEALSQVLLAIKEPDTQYHYYNLPQYLDHLIK